MTIAIIVDAACDLPVDFCVQNDIHIIPIDVVFGDRKFLDERDPEFTRKFYQNYSRFPTLDAYSQPPSVQLIFDFLISNIATKYEQAMIMCLSSTRSKMYESITEAARLSRKWLNETRDKSGILLKTVRIMDTRTLFTGQALLAYEAHRVTNLLGKVSIQDLYQVLRVLSVNVHVFTVPHDLYFLRNRAALHGENSVGFGSYLLGKTIKIHPIITMEQGMSKQIDRAWGFHHAISKMFKMAVEAIDAGLMINAIMVSYAGNTREIKMLDSYRDLRLHAEKDDIQVYLSVMSAAAGINVGPGAVSIAYCN